MRTHALPENLEVIAQAIQFAVKLVQAQDKTSKIPSPGCRNQCVVLLLHYPQFFDERRKGFGMLWIATIQPRAE